MKGREVIDHLTRHEMPDMQAVKSVCHQRAASHDAIKSPYLVPNVQVVKSPCLQSAIAHDFVTSPLKQRMVAAQNITKNKRYRVFYTAATVAACVLITTFIVTAGYFLGGFDRLRSILGDDRVDALTSDGASIPGNEFEHSDYSGGFDRLRGIIGHDWADALTPIEAVLFYESGFRGELVAVGGMDSNVVDVFLTLEDMVGNRLDSQFQIQPYFMYAQRSSFSVMPSFINEIDRTDCGMVTLHSRHVFTQPISGQGLVFGLHHIRYNFREEALAIDFDLGTLSEQTPVAFLWDTPILPPHLHDISVTLSGFEQAGQISISSMGLIHGRLHIQELYDLTASLTWTGNNVHLINPNGDIIQPLRGTHDNTASVSFNINERGDFYNNRGFNFATSDLPYREHIYEINIGRLSEYRLVSTFAAYDILELDWRLRTQFEIDMPPEQVLMLDGLDIRLERYGSIIHEMRITPMTVHITASRLNLDDIQIGLSAGFGDDFIQLRIQLRLITGELIDVNFGGTTVLDLDLPEFTEMMLIDGEPVRLEDLDAILIDGEVITIR